MNIAQAKRISITEYLGMHGIKPASERNGQSWYLSPIRTEDTASFKVNQTMNVWYDFGQGKGGDIIDLVKAMEGASNTANALQKLSETMGRTTQIERPRPTTKTENESKDTAVVESVGLVQSASLKAYLKERGIGLLTASQLREVHYSRGGNQYFAVGLENASGGYELRSKHFKGTLGKKDISVIPGDSKRVLVFEGMFDYLTYLETTSASPSTAIILNSVGLKDRALARIKLLNPEEIELYRDNDSAGEELLEFLRSQLPDVNIRDLSTTYAPAKDLNEWHLNGRLDKERRKVAVR